ncbi:hypothetical protein B0H11DRAFT_1921004 [Mycena galericulata]|nr:hypothetical protein B0H11DRAFT_1921004 [Mycena galericulata]
MDSHSLSGAERSRGQALERAKKLMDEYRKQDESLEDATVSTAQGALMLSLKVILEASDIADKGFGVASRFSLNPFLFERLNRIMGELQYFLQKTAALVPNRKKHFWIDPEDAILPILAGCSDRAQLLVVWEILRTRLELGQKFIEKYVKEIENPLSIEDFSPASTTVELTEGFKALDSPGHQIRHMLAYYPHHNMDARNHQDRLHILTEDWESLAQRGRQEESSEPEWGSKMEGMYSPLLQEPEPVSLAEEEEDDDTIGRKEKGKGKETGTSDSQDMSFTMDHRSRMMDTPTTGVSISSLGQMEGRTSSTPLDLPPALQDQPSQSGLLAPDTPFKSTTNFWKGVIASSSPLLPIPEAETTPNVLSRLATGPIGSTGDHFAATFQREKAKENIPSTGPLGSRIFQLQSRPSNPFEAGNALGTGDASANPSSATFQVRVRKKEPADQAEEGIEVPELEVDQAEEDIPIAEEEAQDLLDPPVVLEVGDTAEEDMDLLDLLAQGECPVLLARLDHRVALALRVRLDLQAEAEEIT